MNNYFKCKTSDINFISKYVRFGRVLYGFEFFYLDKEINMFDYPRFASEEDFF